MLPNYLHPLTPNSYTQNHYQHIAQHLNSLQLEPIFHPFPHVIFPTFPHVACHVQSSPLDFQPSHQGIDDIFSRLPAVIPDTATEGLGYTVYLTLKNPEWMIFEYIPRSLIAKAPEKMVVV